jgi:hypothetical protein
MMKLLDPLPTGYTTGPLKFASDGIPTYGECRELISMLAYRYWQEGVPGSPQDHWLKAEWTLFLGKEYTIYVCYGEPSANNTFESGKWEAKIVLPNDQLVTPPKLHTWGKKK